jgi:hypothetical protein
MNLPVDALEFLDIFSGFLNNANEKFWNLNNLPIVHVYCFATGDTEEEC